MPSFLPSMTAALCWGLMFPIAGAALRDVDAVHLTAVRYGLASLGFLAILVLVEGRAALRYDGRFGRVFLLGTAGFAGFNLLVYAAIPHTTPQGGALVVATMPLLTVLVRWRLYDARPSRAQLGWAALAFLGVALVLTKGDPGELVRGAGVGDVLCLVGALCWVGYTLGAAGLPGWSPLRFTALSAAAGSLSIVMIAVVADVAGWLSFPDAGQWGAVGPELAYITIAGALIGVLAWNDGVKRLGPADASLFMNLVPVAAFAVAIAQGTRPGAVELSGAALALVALVGANVAARRAAERSAPNEPSAARPILGLDARVPS
jgi:drug/metabolite transporter (DMT)-like permease